MELHLNRVDYAQVGTTSKGTLVLLPAPPQQNQRVVVGGHNGVLLCFSRKKHDTTVVFKTLPGPKIESLALGGALGTVQDKMFFAAGNMVKGYSKKGKQFFAFETNFTEPVQSMCIYGVDMFLCGSYTFNHYHDCQDTHYFLCGDRVNDVLCLPVVEGSWVGRGLTPVLAVDDRTLKLLDGSNLSYQVQTKGVPNILLLFHRNGAGFASPDEVTQFVPKARRDKVLWSRPLQAQAINPPLEGHNGNLVLYGTKDGCIGLAELPAGSGSVLWEVMSPNGSSCISAIDSYDLTGDDVCEIIVGREDGLVEIWTQDDLEPPSFKQKVNCNESITALRCGRVASGLHDEVVVLTYTGWVFALTTEPIARESGPNQDVSLDPSVQAKIVQLRGELEALSAEVAAERDSYHAATQDSNGLSAVPIFPINDRFTLSAPDAAYLLSIELMVPIDYILLQCDIPVDLLDVEKNSAVVSLTHCDPPSGNALLATYRCQANTTRLEMKIRSIEGQHGTLQAYVSPRTQPKICQVRQYNIKPLSLHQRIHNYDHNRAQNVLRITGNFSLGEAHSWSAFCLPDLPEKPPPGDKAEFAYASTFTSTHLLATYSKGAAEYRSDNISTIAILRDVLSKEATKRKIKISISCEISEESVLNTLQLLHPKLEYHLNLSKKVHLAEALKELSLQEKDTSFMSDEFKDLLQRSDELSNEHRSWPSLLSPPLTVPDWRPRSTPGAVVRGSDGPPHRQVQAPRDQRQEQETRFPSPPGIDVNWAQVSELMAILDNYNLESLLAFFQSNPN